MSYEIKPTVSVPCNGCTACCHSELIILHPEQGDVVSTYETIEIIHPFSKAPVHALKHKPNGDCVYLGEAGCTIHDRAPVICREFDCRRFAKMAGNRKQRLAAATQSDVVKAGLARMKTL